MFARLALLSTLSLAMAGVVADEDVVAKTVIGPSNIALHEGATALRAGEAERGIELTQRGLKFAANRREEIIAHANLCAGFLLVKQLDSALEHCNWVIEHNPNHWRTYNNRAIVYLRLERYEESEADIRKGQQLRPHSEKLKEVKGMYLDEVEPVKEHITIDDRRGGAPQQEDGDH